MYRSNLWIHYMHANKIKGHPSTMTPDWIVQVFQSFWLPWSAYIYIIYIWQRSIPSNAHLRLSFGSSSWQLLLGFHNVRRTKLGWSGQQSVYNLHIIFEWPVHFHYARLDLTACIIGGIMFTCMLCSYHLSCMSYTCECVWLYIIICHCKSDPVALPHPRMISQILLSIWKQCAVNACMYI